MNNFKEINKAVVRTACVALSIAALFFVVGKTNINIELYITITA